MAGTDTVTHVFEQAGLGRAPFRLAGVEDTAAGVGEDGLVRRDVGGVTVHAKPGGSCDFCGNYIKVFCWVRSSDGRRFKVGSSCVDKAGKAGDRRLASAAKRARNPGIPSGSSLGCQTTWPR